MNFRNFQLDHRKTAALLGVILGITIVVFAAPHAHAMQPIQDVLGGADGKNIRNLWNAFLSFANSIMIVALLVIAFANILHYQIDNYGIKKILPSLVIAVILANFSFFICRMMIDIANMVLKFIMDGSWQNTTGKCLDPSTGEKVDASINCMKLGVDVGNVSKVPTPGATDFWAQAGSFGLGQLARIIGAGFILVLSFLFFIRNWVLYFLIVLSPVAFIAMAIPQGKSVVAAWWKNFIQWNFMVVVAAFWLWVGALFISSNLVDDTSQTMIFVFAIACYYFALTTPFKMGGAIMSGWGNLGKKAWSATGGATGRWANARYIQPGIADVKDRAKNWYGDRILGVQRDEKTGEVLRDEKGNPIMNRKGVGKLLGWQYDRATGIRVNREDRAKRWTNIQNQMQGNTMNYWGKERRLKRQYNVDESNSFLGEIERTEAAHRLEFLQTEKGIVALQRSLAYAKHMEALQQGIKNQQTKRELEWTQESGNIITKKNGDPWLSGDGFWTRRHIHDQQLIALQEAASLDLAARKKAGDIGGTQEAAAAQMDFGAVLMHNLVKEREDILKLTDTDIPQVEKDGLLGILDGAMSDCLDKIQEGVQKHVYETLHKDDATGQITLRTSPLLKEMGGEIVKIDKNGKVEVNKDWDKMGTLKSQGEMLDYAYDSEEREIISDRAGKVMTLKMKEELAIESEKRKGVESGDNLMGNAKLWNEYQNFLTKNLQSAGMWSMRDGLARFENLLKSATNYQDPSQGEALLKVWKEVRKLTKVNGNAASVIIDENNSVLSKAFTAALRDKNYVDAMATAYKKAAGALKITNVVDEKSFIKAEADAAGDDAKLARLGDIRAEVDGIRTQTLLQTLNIDPKSLDGKLDVALKKDTYGHISEVEVTSVKDTDGKDIVQRHVQRYTDANGNLNDDELKKDKQATDEIGSLQNVYDHVADVFKGVSLRSEIGKAFSGGMTTTMSVYRNQFHSFFEKANKAIIKEVEAAVDEASETRRSQREQNRR